MYQCHFPTEQSCLALNFPSWVTQVHSSVQGFFLLAWCFWGMPFHLCIAGSFLLLVSIVIYNAPMHPLPYRWTVFEYFKKKAAMNILMQVICEQKAYFFKIMPQDRTPRSKVGRYIFLRSNQTSFKVVLPFYIYSTQGWKCLSLCISRSHDITSIASVLKYFDTVFTSPKISTIPLHLLIDFCSLTHFHYCAHEVFKNIFSLLFLS